MKTLHPPNLILLYDGYCSLCNNSVNFVLKYEKSPRIKFAALQSQAGIFFRDALNLEEDTKSVIFVEYITAEKMQVFTRSDVLVRVSICLRWPWKFLALLRFVPAIIRDTGYNFVARYRYKIWGKRDTCRLEMAGKSDRFIQEISDLK